MAAYWLIARLPWILYILPVLITSPQWTHCAADETIMEPAGLVPGTDRGTVLLNRLLLALFNLDLLSMLTCVFPLLHTQRDCTPEADLSF